MRISDWSSDVCSSDLEVGLSDGRQTRAELVGADPESDLAVLKIDLPDLRAIGFNGEHQVRTGDVVLAIGNPFGVGQTTTMGIVSALGRNRRSEERRVGKECVSKFRSGGSP